METKFNLASIKSSLNSFSPKKIRNHSKKSASVAMILKESGPYTEMFFIERAADERDPWSGHIAFPGGKIEYGEDSKTAAIRECMEEVGIDLTTSEHIGQLSDIVGANLPVVVSCHVFSVDNSAKPEIGNEVKDIFWIPLRQLYCGEAEKKAPVSFDGRSFEMPAIILPFPDKPPLWGITYRLVTQLHKIVVSTNCDDKVSFLQP